MWKKKRLDIGNNVSSIWLKLDEKAKMENVGQKNSYILDTENLHLSKIENDLSLKREAWNNKNKLL